MSTVDDLWPLFRLKVSCGPLELRPPTDADLAGLVDVARRGVHEPDRMPFLHPWTDASSEELPLRVLQYHWGKRSAFAPQQWSIELAVRWHGELVGTQGVTTRDFLVTRTGETGSWLGIGHQNRGIGTLMRQAVCALCFDHLGFEEITSGAFLDNAASLAVSRKVGYVPNGVQRLKRRDEMAPHQHLVLRPEEFVRPADPVEVEGVAGVRRLIGLETPPGTGGDHS